MPVADSRVKLIQYVVSACWIQRISGFILRAATEATADCGGIDGLLCEINQMCPAAV